MKTFYLLLCTVLLFGCSGVEVKTTDSQGVTTTVIDVSQSKLAVATHADLQAAAAYATAHGYPSRAAVWQAHDAHLTAVEAQISACANAIAAARPSAPTAPAGAGVFTGIEIAAEAVGSFQVTPQVKILCEPLPVPVLPDLPRIP